MQIDLIKIHNFFENWQYGNPSDFCTATIYGGQLVAHIYKLEDDLRECKHACETKQELLYGARQYIEDLKFGHHLDLDAIEKKITLTRQGNLDLPPDSLEIIEGLIARIRELEKLLEENNRTIDLAYSLERQRWKRIQVLERALTLAADDHCSDTHSHKRPLCGVQKLKWIQQAEEELGQRYD